MISIIQELSNNFISKGSGVNSRQKLLLAKEALLKDKLKGRRSGANSLHINLIDKDLRSVNSNLKNLKRK